MDEFQFKDFDRVGLGTLSVIEEAKNFNYWMYSVIRPYLKGNVLEIGSGTGNISTFAIADKFDIVLSDIRANYRAILKDKFSESPQVRDVIDLDIVDKHFAMTYKELLGKFDSIFCLNVVEHVKDDSIALQNCSSLLASGGTMVILVPAFQGLYNEFDHQLEHYRRYTQKSLEAIFPRDLAIVHSTYFNFFGIFGWYLSGKLMKKSTIPAGQMKLYDRLVHVLKYLDDVVFHKAGLSVVVAGKKTNRQD